MLIKRIISAALILGVMAAFAVAGSPVFAACHTPAAVTIYNHVDTTPTPEQPSAA